MKKIPYLLSFINKINRYSELYIYNIFKALMFALLKNLV